MQAEEKIGFFAALVESAQIQEHMERQMMALWILRWTPWLLFVASALLAMLLAWRWQSWSTPRLKRCIGLLLGAAIVLPLMSTLIAVYPLFFSIDRPGPNEIGEAITEAVSALGFGVLLDVAVLLLFLVVRAVRSRR